MAPAAVPPRPPGPPRGGRPSPGLRSRRRRRRRCRQRRMGRPLPTVGPPWVHRERERPASGSLSQKLIPAGAAEDGAAAEAG
eukprot:scaffold75201_cov21-Phaeocystis_antarctica.AAC.1